MAKILEMPKLSPTMEEGVLSAWHKKEGDAIQTDDLLAEVETDKATMEFRAFDKGTILKILIAPGTEVKLGQAVAILGNPGEDISALIPSTSNAPAAAKAPSPESKKEPAAAEPAQAKSEPTAEEKPADKSPKAAPRTQSSGPPAGPRLDRTEFADTYEDAGSDAQESRVLASPYIRKTARSMGVDLQNVSGSGPKGRIVAADLTGLDADGPKSSTPGALATPESRSLSPMRKAIARRLVESKQTVPHFYLTVDCDAGELVALRERINADAAEAPTTKTPSELVKISLNDLLIRACAIALRRVPECNAQFTADAILVHRRIDISVAVAVPDGLVTPVVRNADKLGVVGIAQTVRDLATRARAKKLKPEEMQNGTFSISNLGMFGIDTFSAVINPPEGAILAVGRARDEAIVRDGSVVAGKRIAMTLSCDHRVIDGAVGASFLSELRKLVEHPLRILTE